MQGSFRNVSPRCTRLLLLLTYFSAGTTFFGVVEASLNPANGGHDKFRCEKINIDFCKDMEYNSTMQMGSGWRNEFTGKESQAETEKDLKMYQSLVDSGCSPDLKKLLCSIYLPFCHEKTPKPVYACRPLCEKVLKKCHPVLSRSSSFGQFSFPPALNCSRLPYEKNVADEMCIPDVEATRPPFVPKPTTKSVITQEVVVSSARPEEKTTTQPAVTKPTISVVKVRSTRKLCRILYTKNEVNYFYVEKIRACALHCTKDGAFTARDKETLEEWINGLAYMCALLCVFAIFAVVCNYSKTNFPERPIVFITVCYFFYSIAFIIRIVIGREGTSCQEEGGEHYLLLDGSGNISCATTFLLAYCFSMAQSIWWVVLTVCWFLSAGMRWKSERIKKKAAYFHFFA